MKNIEYFNNLKNKELFSSLVVYDATFSRLANDAGVDILVVGDSLAMNIQGAKTTIETNVENIIYHTKAVVKGNYEAFIIADMPAFSYVNKNCAIKNASRLIKAGVPMIKIEGGENWTIDIIKNLTEMGISICGHLGLTPQYYHKLGGHKVQGKTDSDKERIFNQAMLLQEAGIEMLVLECVPEDLGKSITKSLSIPVFGAGAGRFLDGQVLLAYDVLGLTGTRLKFAKNFISDCNSPLEAFSNFSQHVKRNLFPTENHVFIY